MTLLLLLNPAPARQPYVVSGIAPATAGASLLLRNPAASPPAGAPENLFTTQTPGIPDVFENQNVTVGTTFTVAVSGVVSGGRFYAPATVGSGTFELVLYRVDTDDNPAATGTGTQLATATFGALTPSAWNTVSFSSSVAVTPGVAYRIGVRTSEGRYAATSGFFSSAPLVNGNLTGIQTGTDPVGIGLLDNGNFIESISAYLNKTFGGNSYLVDPTFISDAAVASATPRPLVVTSPASSGLAAALVLRAPVVAAAVVAAVGVQPYVVAAPPPAAPAGQAQLLRSSLADVAAPATSTPGPYVITVPAGPPAAGVALTLRTAPAALPGVQPYVVTSPAAGPSGAALVERGSLADDPVLTTRPAYVAAGPAIAASPPAALLGRNPAAPIVAPATTSAQPYVLTVPATATTGAAILGRATLADPPVLTTPAPLVVTSPASIRAPLAILSRTPAVDVAAAGRQPVIAAGPATAVRPQAILVRPPTPAAAVGAVRTPGPYVVAARTVLASGQVLILRAASGVCDCDTHRPATGTTGRPASGTTSRPSAGVTTRTTSTTSRPNAGITARPCTCSGG